MSAHTHLGSYTAARSTRNQRNCAHLVQMNRGGRDGQETILPHSTPPFCIVAPTMSKHASAKAERLPTGQWTLVIDVQQPHCLPDLPAWEDDEHLSVALLLTEWYGVELTDLLLRAVAEEGKPLQETQELADCPPGAPDWAPWTLKTSGRQVQVRLECWEPKPINHLQENHLELPRFFEGENVDQEDQVRA